MNQILITKTNDANYSNYLYNSINFTHKNLENKKKYFIVFLFSISICAIILFYFLYLCFFRLNEQNRTILLKERYNINTLYSNNTNYKTLKLSNDITIIGLIYIHKINIT